MGLDFPISVEEARANLWLGDRLCLVSCGLGGFVLRADQILIGLDDNDLPTRLEDTFLERSHRADEPSHPIPSVASFVVDSNRLSTFAGKLASQGQCSIKSLDRHHGFDAERAGAVSRSKMSASGIP